MRTLLVNDVGIVRLGNSQTTSRVRLPGLEIDHASLWACSSRPTARGSSGGSRMLPARGNFFCFADQKFDVFGLLVFCFRAVVLKKGKSCCVLSRKEPLVMKRF